jgi:hypothetical protein
MKRGRQRVSRSLAPVTEPLASVTLSLPRIVERKRAEPHPLGPASPGGSAASQSEARSGAPTSSLWHDRFQPLEVVRSGPTEICVAKNIEFGSHRTRMSLQ